MKRSELIRQIQQSTGEYDPEVRIRDSTGGYREISTITNEYGHLVLNEVPLPVQQGEGE